MMKTIMQHKNKIIAGLLALATVVGLLAFSPNSVTLQASALSYDESGAAAFDEGDQIRAINATRAGKSKSDAVYTVTELNQWIPATSNYLTWQGTQENTFYGVYPATADYDEFTIPTDQSGGTDAADWMTDTYTAAKSAGDVTFCFEHRLAKVTVNVTGWKTEFDGANKQITEPKIWSKGAVATATYGADGTVTVTSDEALTAITSTADSQTFTAIVAPAQYAATDTFMTLTVDGQEMTVLAAADVLTDGLEPGNHYEFNLTVGKDLVELSSITVNPWNDATVAAQADQPAIRTIKVSDTASFLAAVEQAEMESTAKHPMLIKLGADITLPEIDPPGDTGTYGVQIETGVMTIDLNGHTLDSEAIGYTLQIGQQPAILCDAEVTIIDSSSAQTGRIINTNQYGDGIYNTGTLIFSGGELAAYMQNAGGTVLITGGKISVDNNKSVHSYGDLTITGGEISNESGEAIVVQSGTCTITGGTFTGDYAALSVAATTSSTPLNVSVSGGTFIATHYALELRTATSISITGGSFKGNFYDINAGKTIRNVLNFDPVTGVGPTFPGGICVSYHYQDPLLTGLLGVGAGYYDADGELVAIDEDADEIADRGDITVKKLP